MNSKYTYWLWIFIASLAAAAPIYLIKKYWQNPDFMYIILIILTYVVLTYAYLMIFKNHDISVAYAFLKVLSIILVVIIGIFVFKESVQTKTYVGIIFGIIALILLA